jgi:hypothetical protein
MIKNVPVWVFPEVQWSVSLQICYLQYLSADLTNFANNFYTEPKPQQTGIPSYECVLAEQDKRNLSVVIYTGDGRRSKYRTQLRSTEISR